MRNVGNGPGMAGSRVPASGSSAFRRSGGGVEATSRGASPIGASSVFYDGADNATHHAPYGPGALGGDWGDAAANPSLYSWKADPSRNRPPPNIQPSLSGLRGNGGSSLSQNAKRVETASRPIEKLDERGGAGGDFKSGATNTNWLGGPADGAIPDTLERATLQHAFGSGDFSMVDRQQLTLTRLIHLMLDATLKPRDPDSRGFGGDGATKLAEQREELKTMDQRIVPFQHDDVMNDYLKNIDRLHSPSGALCQRDVLKGRLVGLLFFTESERSLTFMRYLQVFHRRHSPDFVVVAVSLAAKEMMDITRSFGFFHCTHRDGASWVSRDAGLVLRPFVALPRLIVVNGTSGIEVTRGGVTAVMANPETCFQAWRRGEGGFRYRDWFKSMYM
ncbi:hypothetical protein LPMP_205510 [Leishmania panamensis]|uniref:Thioredoxin-like protein, putative n=3 Tax=Leishmania guyanensis species complex TaxID=38579 RepID=A0A088RPL7_LEIPA|nr:hypothetical protein LPMP_205510 [Leishmania panamensis]AIN98042.1 hypothetical protein LPMP_205510 [Leishmania panamensis]CCM15276.1 hypothetical protein, conserved [Leishmania guyanensis]